jgi:hypothetical protein
MKFLKRIFDFYVFSNIHVALACFCLTKITLLEYRIENNIVAWFVFFAVLASYNFIRLYKFYTVQSWVFQFINNNLKVILSLTIFSTIVVVYLVFLLKLKVFYLLIPAGIFTFFYTVPIPFSNNRSFNLRSIAFLKLFLIAFSWAGVTVLLPLLNYNIDIGFSEVIKFTQRFLFIIVITIPFDIRDFKFDQKSLKTLPHVLGINQSKIFGLIMLMLFLGLLFVYPDIDINRIRTHFYIAVISFLLLFNANDNQNKYYSAFWVESIPIVWLMLSIAIN